MTLNCPCCLTPTEPSDFRLCGDCEVRRCEECLDDGACFGCAREREIRTMRSLEDVEAERREWSMRLTRGFEKALKILKGAQ